MSGDSCHYSGLFTSFLSCSQDSLKLNHTALAELGLARIQVWQLLGRSHVMLLCQVECTWQYISLLDSDHYSFLKPEVLQGWTVTLSPLHTAILASCTQVRELPMKKMQLNYGILP